MTITEVIITLGAIILFGGLAYCGGVMVWMVMWAIDPANVPEPFAKKDKKP